MQERSSASGNSASADGFHVSLPNDRQILITRSFSAPRQLVFDAWTRPEHISRWWDPAGTPLEACEVDLKPRGRFRFIHHASAGGHIFTGVYGEISPPECLEMRVEFPFGIATSTLVFTDQGSRTGFMMTMDCGSLVVRDSLLAMRVDEGTGRTLANLDRHLQSLRGAA